MHGIRTRFHARRNEFGWVRALVLERRTLGMSHNVGGDSARDFVLMHTYLRSDGAWTGQAPLSNPPLIVPLHS